MDNEDEKNSFYELLADDPVKKRKEFYRILLFNYVTLDKLTNDNLKIIIPKIIYKHNKEIGKEKIIEILKKYKDGAEFMKLIHKPNVNEFIEKFKRLDINPSELENIYNYIKHQTCTDEEDEDDINYLYIDDIRSCSATIVTKIVSKICSNWENKEVLKQHRDTFVSCFEYYQLTGKEVVSISRKQFAKLIFNFTSNNKLKAKFLKIHKRIHEIQSQLGIEQKQKKSYPVHIYKSVKCFTFESFIISLLNT